MNVWISARRNGDEDEDVFVFLLTGATSLYGGEIIGILTVLFRFLGYGFRLAVCSVNWMEAREFGRAFVTSVNTRHVSWSSLPG